MSLSLISNLFETLSSAIDENKQVTGFYIFHGFIIMLFIIRFNFARYIERTRWFVDRSVRFALWAAAWCCVALLLRSALGSTHAGLFYVAVGPMMLIMISMLTLILLEIPIAWASTIMDALSRFRRRD